MILTNNTKKAELNIHLLRYSSHKEVKNTLYLSLKARQGKFICIAHFLYKTIQSALHKTFQALQ